MDPTSPTREELEAFAGSRGGVLLSEEATGWRVKHRWRCGRGHEFEASPQLLMEGGYWCPTCYPTVHDQSGWDWDTYAEIDPLLRRFHNP